MKNRSWYVFSVFMLALSLGGNAANIHVVPGGAGTQDGTSWANAKDLHDGINNATSADTVWVKQGTYEIPPVQSLSPVCPVYGGFVGHETALDQRNPDPTLTIVKCPLWVLTPSTAQLNDMNLRKNESVYAVIEMSDGSIRNCIIEEPELEITSSVSSGAKVYNSIFKNQLLFATAIVVHSSGKASFYDSEFHDLNSVEGGVIYNQGELEIHRCVFHNNSGSFRGGVLYAISGVKIYNSLFYNNTGEGGSALYFFSLPDEEVIDIRNCTFSGNTTTTEFGYHGPIEIDGGNAQVNIFNSIIWGNPGGVGDIVCSLFFGGTVNVFNNILEKGIADEFTPQATNQGDNIDLDPIFVNPAANDYRLDPCSPAINTGNNGFVNQALDLDGNPRIYEGTGDRGAYELQVDISVCNKPPIAICQNLTVSTDDGCQNSATVASDFNGGSVDPEGGTLSFSVTPAGPYALGTTIVSLTVSDPEHNASTCSTTISVIDNEVPTITCPTDQTQTVDPGECEASVTVPLPVFDDNCGVANVSNDVTGTVDASGTYPVGTTTITWTVVDTWGQHSICTANVSVQSNLAPTAACRDASVELDASGNANITTADIDNNSYDICGIASLSLDREDFNCADVGTQIVTLTVTDNNGNTSNCTANVSVEDNLAPTAACRDASVELDANGNGNITGTDINNNSYDVCGIASLNLDREDFSCADIGTQIVTLTVTDNSGNSSTCTANVSVNDHVAPMAACRDVWLTLSSGEPGYISTSDINDSSYDNCGIASLSLDREDFSCADIGTHIVTLTVTDNNGNSSTCTANVNVQDKLPPTAICRDASVELDAIGNGNITSYDINNASYDACGIASLSLDREDFNCADVGIQVVTLTVTDNGGNASTCTANVSVHDNQVPYAVCRDASVELDDIGNGNITTADINNASYDACGIASLSLDREDFSCADVGTQIVTLTVTDNNGNSSTCTANVSVNDHIAPMAACRDVWLTLSSGEPGYISTSDINDGSYDACGIASLSLDREDFSCADIGTHVVTLTVIDNNSNSSTCTANVTVQDKLPPTAVCRDATVELDANGNGNITTSEINDNSYDACGIASLSLDREDFNCADVGIQVVTLTVTDNNGNTSNCTATVTINPGIACQEACTGIDQTVSGTINADLEVHTQSSVSLSNVLIENGVSVNITAGNIITFEPGTVIQAGAQLSARIEDCSPEVQALSESELPEMGLSENKTIGQIQIAPNPFRQQVNISFELLESAPVSLIIYNALGRRVGVLATGKNYAIGHQEWTFLRNNHPAGMYLAHLKVGDQLFIKKMILVE